MRKYELMMITDPTLSDADRETLFTEVKAELTTHSITIVSEDAWGVRDLAYKINASTTGYYMLYQLESDGSTLIAVTKDLNLKKSIWRHMFVRTDE